MGQSGQPLAIMREFHLGGLRRETAKQRHSTARFDFKHPYCTRAKSGQRANGKLYAIGREPKGDGEIPSWNGQQVAPCPEIPEPHLATAAGSERHAVRAKRNRIDIIVRSPANHFQPAFSNLINVNCAAGVSGRDHPRIPICNV